MASLVDLDSIEIRVIVDNELDPISPTPNPTVQQSGGLKDIGLNGAPIPKDSRGGAERELRMNSICCSAHGLSLMITGIIGNQRRTMLFDTGPEEDVWERNAHRLRADVGQIEMIHLSHWHRDHSGGMLKAIKLINEAKPNGEQVSTDLHPSRPDYRGIMAVAPISLEADPTFDEIDAAGGSVVKNNQPHTVLDDMFLISGEIPRTTAYEQGLPRGIRFHASEGVWKKDNLIMDERFVMCRLKGSTKHTANPNHVC